MSNKKIAELVGLGLLAAGLYLATTKKSARPTSPGTRTSPGTGTSPGADPSLTPGFGMVSRGAYSFTYSSHEHLVQLEDFLGINPPGVDLDAYLSRLDIAALASWNNYWQGIFQSWGRQDLVDFAASKYRQYIAIPPSDSGTGQLRPSFGGFTIGNVIGIRFWDSPPNDYVHGARIVYIETGGNYGDGSPAIVNVDLDGRVKTFTWTQFQGRSPVLEG